MLMLDQQWEGTIHGVELEHALIHGEDDTIQGLIRNGADPSLVNPKNLGQSGMKRYEKLRSWIERQSHSSNQQKVIEEENMNL